MFKIQTLNAISPVGLKELPEKQFQVSDTMDQPDGVIVRSFDMHQMELPETLLGIARAGAGVNNIPVEQCAEKGIVVFNTPGANANAVKELVLTGIFLSSRKVISAIEWAKSLEGKENVDKLVEKGKKQFVGPEVKGKCLGVIGLGSIGVLVANAAISLGMEVIGFDPYLSVDAAWKLSSAVKKADNIEQVAAKADYITIHVPLLKNTEKMVNENLLSYFKDGARLLNFARGELVDIDAVKGALQSGKLSCYITDFPNEELFGTENVVLIPHLGASTPESEENCAQMAAKELKNFLEFGVIKNSVNFPDCDVPYSGKGRIAIAHKNIPNMLSSITSALARADVNIDNLINKSKGQWAYTIADVDEIDVDKVDEIIAEIKKVNGVVRARVVRLS
ncbi:MAG: phosphoglycerate dehydrogenase [Clostridiales bacterium]|nr:phosphoglycerate dehydrogenase [Clostridiales bacterium]